MRRKHSHIILGMVGLCCAGTVVLGAPSSSIALTIALGSTTLNQPNWYSAGYGNLAYTFKLVSGQNNGQDKKGGQLNGGYMTFTELGGALTGGTSASIQDPAGGTFQPQVYSDTPGITDSSFHDIMDFTFGAGTPTNLTLDVWILVGDNEVNAGAPKDVPRNLRLANGASGGTANASVVPNNTTTSPEPDWYEFTVTGINSGTTLYVSAETISTASPNRFNPINGVAFELPTTAPEPSTFALALSALAGLGLVALRRKRIE